MPIAYDYYTIKVPGDLADDLETLGQHAINEAADCSHIYAMPCTWSAKHLSGEVGDWWVTFQVVRKRNRRTIKHVDSLPTN